MRMFRTALVVVALAFVVTGCGSKASAKLIGKWTIDIDKMADMEQLKKLPADQKKAALEMAKGMASSMTFEFTADKMLVDAGGKKMAGTYKVKSETADEVVIDGTMDGKTETMTIEVKGDGLVMGKGGDPDKIPLKKK